MHPLRKHAHLRSHHPLLLLLLLHQVSLLVVVGAPQLEPHHLLIVTSTYALLARTRLVGLLLSLLLQELGVEDVIGVLGHELVRETVPHPQLLVGLVEVLLGSLLLHIGRMLLLLLL